jgi:hypothetical protein
MPALKRRSPERTDPRNVSVQMSLRMPFWRREQLDDEAAALHLSTSSLILDAIDRVYPPMPPKAK